jgi:hypothetical protein
MKAEKIGKLHKLTFESSVDVWEYIKDHHKDPDNYSVRYDDTNFCPYSFEETRQCLKAGWPEGIKEVSYATDYIEDMFDEESGYAIEHDVTGDYLDVGAYMDGVPECFGRVIPAQGKKKAVDVVVNVTYSASIKQEHIFNRGAAITALVNQLQNQFFVNLWFVEKVNKLRGTKEGKGNRSVEIWFKVDTQDDYSKDLTAFYAAHPGFLRRIIFAIEEKYTGEHDLGSYGKIVPVTVSSGTIYFKHMSSMDDDSKIWTSIDRSAQHVKKILENFIRANTEE